MSERTTDTATIDRKRRMGLPAQHPASQDPAIRQHNWNEVSLGFTREQAIAEAERCIHCPAAPCQKACPLHNDISTALQYVENGDLLAAAATFRLTSPLPEVCSRVCPQERLCEGSCVIGKRGAPVHIGLLERFAVDTQRGETGLPKIPTAPATGKSVAIIGAGPAGLAAAEDLRKRGHRVVVFDSWPLPGGVLRYGIPCFKLPKSLIADKCAQLTDAGVEFACRTRIDGATGLARLREQGFDAILLANGADAPARLGIAGEDLRGVWSATDFLVRANLPAGELPSDDDEPLIVGKRVVVVGGGDTGMDCCRSAIRSGAEDVVCLYRRTEAEMPGRKEERAYAREEGVRFEFLASPVRLIGTNGAVSQIECTRMQLGEPDPRGRRQVTPIPDTQFTISVDTVIVAAGYHVDDALGEIAPGLNRAPNGTVEADAATLGTNLPGVFAAGDVVVGPNLVVTAAAAGRRAAAAIDSSLTG